MAERSIDDVIGSEMRDRGLGTYAVQARPIIEVLLERERRLSEAIIDFAVAEGMEEQAARDSLRGLGMEVRSQQPVAVMTGTVASAAAANAENPDDPVAVALARINQTLDGLTQFARANGYRG